MAIAIAENQYKTYILDDAATRSRVEIVPERGGIVTQWSYQEQEIFYLDSDRFRDPTLSVRGGIPLLFPICGNLVNDSYTLNGQTYTLKQHGFARELPWEVTQQQENAQASSLTVSLKSNEKTRLGYPFDFVLDYTYTLKANTLELRYRHTNLSAVPMPLATGIHPYFLVTDKSALEVQIPAQAYQAKGAASSQPFTGKFDFNQEEIDFAFTNLSAQSAIVTDHARKLRLTIAFDSHYSTLVFWTVKGKDFYCLEPWSAPRNALNTGENLLVAEPGATVETVITMAVEAI
jgi:galactose mutarotase-like enzyme